MEGVEAVTKGSLKHWTLSLNNFHHLDASPLLCYWDQCLEISGLASSVAALYCGSRTKAPQWKPCTFEQGFPPLPAPGARVNHRLYGDLHHNLLFFCGAPGKF